MQISIDELMEIKSIEKIDGIIHEEYNGIEFDTRRELKDKIFFAFKGENTDGNKFLDIAVKNGAKAIVSSDEECLKKFEDKVTTILVKDNTESLKEILNNKLKNNDIKIIAITGSSGKTSVKEIVYDILSKIAQCGKTSGNFNNMLGISWSILNTDSQIKFFICETGMNHPGELEEISQVISPELALIINVGFVHGGNFRDIDHIAKAKLELLKGLKNKNMAVISGDYKELINNTSRKFKPFFFGKDKKNDLSYKIESFDGVKTNFSISYKEKNYKKSLTTFPFLIENYIAAISVLIKLGLPVEIILERLNTVKVDKRMEVISKENKKIFMDCYNSNPFSLQKIIPTLPIINKEWVLILGDMLELGEKSLFWHQEIGRIISKQKGITLVCIGEMSCMIGEGAIKNGMKPENVFFVNTHKQAAYIIKSSEHNKNIFIKGSRSMKLEKIIEYLEKA